MAGYISKAGELGRCPACEGLVIWAHDTTSETLEMLDRDPREQGDCHFVDDETFEAVSPARAAELKSMGIAMRFRHAVTCPMKVREVAPITLIAEMLPQR